VGQSVAWGSISGVKRYSTEASRFADAEEQSAADSTANFEDDEPQQKRNQTWDKRKRFQDHVLLEIASGGAHPDGGPLADIVRRKVVKKELQWLQDPKALADRVAKILQADDFALAVAIVRGAQKENMECSVGWNHLLEYCMNKTQPKAAWKLYNEMKKRGRKPTSWTYTIMLYGLATVPKNVHIGLNPVQTALSIYRSIYELNSAVKPSIIHSNAMLTVCVRHGYTDTLWEIASELPEEGPCSPDAVTYTLILRAIRDAVSTDVSKMSEIDRILERRAQGVKEGKRIWSDVVYRWSRGQLDLDIQLVRTMARLLLEGGSERDCYDVFALLNQTTGLPILAKKPSPERQRESEMARRRKSRSAENKEMEDVPFVDEGNRPYKPAETEMEEREEKAEQKEDEEDDKEFENLFDSVVSTDSASKMKKGTIGPSYVVPGDKELTILIETCYTMTQGLGTGKAYWKHLTLEDHEYTVKPDMPSLHAYLRLLRVYRASRATVEVVRDQVPEPVSKTFHIAMSCCLRDRRNINVLKNANELLGIMDKSMVLPHPRALEKYLNLVQTLQDNPQRLISLNGLKTARKPSDSLDIVGRKLQLSLQTVALENLRPHIDKLHEAMKNGKTSFISRAELTRAGPGDTVSGATARTVMDRTRGLIDEILKPENASFLSKSDREQFQQESQKLREYSDAEMVRKFEYARLHPTLEQLMAFQEKHDPKQSADEAD
jgi:pentatricopeptide repeat protein